jgi:RNA polymerase sigma factor (TIGR02999 family)
MSEDSSLAAEESGEALDSTTASPAVRRIAAALLPDFYAQVKRMARRERARVRGGETLQTTALAHEAWMRLRDSRGFVDEAHLLRAAALAMRHALVNHAEAQRADKRGGGAAHVTLSHADEVAVGGNDEVIEINDALQKLSRITPRLADVVECRFFAGYGEEETAAALGISLRTAQRDWLKARAWLYRELGGGQGGMAGSGGAS